MWYYMRKLKDELHGLKEAVRRGEANQAIINRIFEIEMLLDNIYYTEEI